VPGTTVNSGPVDLLPGIITFSGNSVPGGGSLPVSLPIVNNGSGAVTQSFVVNFYSALTGTFAPRTPWWVALPSLLEWGATPAPWPTPP
jgi:hypothetical protein